MNTVQNQEVAVNGKQVRETERGNRLGSCVLGGRRLEMERVSMFLGIHARGTEMNAALRVDRMKLLQRVALLHPKQKCPARHCRMI